MPRKQHGTAARIAKVVTLLRGKWTIHILCAMAASPVRLGQLTRKFQHASKKALIASLRSLERAEIIVRKDQSGSVLHVEYELADSVKDLIKELLSFLAAWDERIDSTLNPQRKCTQVSTLEEKCQRQSESTAR